MHFEALEPGASHPISYFLFPIFFNRAKQLQ